ncbi:MAG: aminotransferase class V-fold PLP-dependent enzyme [Neomegalonema sp.]|nr:aminotransferase class V-fold PLP-dependent enzyme [Neomegalonema sp.]
MSLSHGKKVLAIPGPTTVPDEVLQAMHRPAVDIYQGELVAVTEQILADLGAVFRTQSAQPFIYIANGHGAWEAALSNTLSRGDKVLVLESGRFAIGWGETASELGCVVEILPAGAHGAVDPQAVAARLAADKAHAIKAVLVVQIDTATSVWNDIAAIGAAIAQTGHPALYMVDGIASIGCVPFEMEAWGVDLALTGSQKGLMTPPGLSYVLAGPRAVEAHGRADLKTRYWDWGFRQGPLHYHKYCGTPPVQMLFAAQRALHLLLREEGLEAAWARHAALAQATRAAVQHWAGAAEAPPISFAIPDAAHRADTVTTLRVEAPQNAEALRAFCAQTCGVTLGVGLGDARGNSFRIAHMGHINAHGLLGILGSVELGMRYLGWACPSGGVEAAIGALAQILDGPQMTPSAHKG